MPAATVEEPFDDSDWPFEPKRDGFRALACIEGGECRLVSRKRHVHKAWPQLAEKLAGSVRCVTRRARRRARGVIKTTSQESDMNIIYKGMCEQCKAEVIIILRQVRTLENLRGQFTRTCLICERSEVMLEMQGFRGDTA